MAREVTPPQPTADDTEARLALHRRVRRGLWGLAATLLVAGALMCYLMAVVLRAAGAATDPERRDFLAKLALICFITVLWDFILLVWVAWRLIAYRLRPTRHGPTPYINAWALAGRRFRLRKSSSSSMSDPLRDDDNDDQPPDEDDENNTGPDWRQPP